MMTMITKHYKETMDADDNNDNDNKVIIIIKKWDGNDDNYNEKRITTYMTKQKMTIMKTW